MNYKDKIISEFNAEIINVKNYNDMNLLLEIKSKFIGKKGIIVEKFLKNIASLSKEEKIENGKKINVIKKTIEKLIQDKIKELNKLRFIELKKFKIIDTTLPGGNFEHGTIHPLNKIIYDTKTFFEKLNFEFYDGLEIDNNEYNFEKLNTPKDHVARDNNDTFYIDDDLLLRTQCTNVTSRYLTKHFKELEIKMISVGNVYRRDTNDATHSHQFIQIDGLCVGTDHNLANLKYILKEYCSYIFDKEVKIRFRSSYFPFTTPSLEVDVSCIHCNGSGCSTCKQLAWIEIIGAGMVHPNVLKYTNNSNKQGWAFGIGVERIAMIKYKINDIRHFYNNDLRFLRQFKK